MIVCIWGRNDLVVDEFEEVASCQNEIFKIFWWVDFVVTLVEVENNFGDEFWEGPVLLSDLKQGGDFRKSQDVKIRHNRRTIMKLTDEEANLQEMVSGLCCYARRGRE